MKSKFSNIKKSKYFLDNNHCIGIPTETVYGLAANAYSNTATNKIFKLKNRPKKNPLIVHYYKINDLKKPYGGLGISIISTPMGVMSDNKARQKNVGGEVLCEVF